MSRLLLRLTIALWVGFILLVILMGVIGQKLPIVQIIPVVTFDSPTVQLVDVNRHVAGMLRTYPSPVLDAAVSHDQQHIAFSMSTQENIHIFVGSLYEASYRQLTTDVGGTSPAWSADGKQLAFVGLERNNKRGIYTINVDDSSSLQIVLKAGTFASPAWSPDGRQLAFASSRYRDLPDVFVVDSECRLRCDREMMQITDELVVDTLPVWSPDQSHIAFLSDRSGDYEIYMLDMDCMQSGQVKCSLQVPHRLRLQKLVIPFLILWSLDGQELYFRGFDPSRNQSGLYAIDANCYSLPTGCQPRLIYSLSGTLRGKRG
jgi:Tol biopolymer transport system component